MGNYKHIEACVGEYIAKTYPRAIEVGMGRNTVAAEIVHARGALQLCTDIRVFPHSPDPADLPFTVDDVFSPDHSLYKNAAVIYAIRPAIEMIPPLIDLAQAICCDLVVYHLGFETYGRGGEVIDCGVLLHRYHKGNAGRSETVEEG
jgi:uncharacterized protein